MPFPQSFLDELIDRSDIVDVVGSYVQLTRKGSNLFGLCPFHSEKTGSFSVSPDKQIYYCFGCKKGGGVVNFIMEEENLSFPDAVRFLAKRAGMEVPEEDGDREAGRRRARLLDLNREAARFYYQMLQQKEAEAVAAYLSRRRITRATAVRFGLGASLDEWDALTHAMGKKGYTKTELLAAGLAVQGKNGGIYDKFRNRLMFPVIDVRGDVVAFGGRVIDQSEPKYMNTSETAVYSKRRLLYGLNLAKKTKRPNIILCEGNIDVVMLHQAGFDNAVASMGTALTVEQTRLLSRYTKELVLCYDNDGAGRIATERALQILNNSEFSVRVLQLPRRLNNGEYVKQDADDFIKFQGKDAFERLLSGSENGMEFRMAQVAAKYDLNDDTARVAYSEEISALLSTLSNAVEREVYAVRAAETARISPEAMRSEVQRALKRRLSQEKKAQLKKELNPAAELQPRQRSLRYENVRSALAEEGILRLLALDDSLKPEEFSLPEERFSSPLLRRIYAALKDARAQGRPLSIAAMASDLTPEEMSHLTGVMQKPEVLANSAQALQDYIRVVNDEYTKRTRQAGLDPLLAAQEKYKEKKGRKA
ncbi:DNA primase [Oscillibacter sp. MSJ-2]|uniref:DNA primase n=1 Tax=Dysosmobacter acutus TaxID=2841504 RepID=A0ABS6FC38_9FIRM|nr:DNA primase [Dysosmobacter acutus]MBU5626904.1 DNA primase [Dysosmobacter acutus]